MSNYVYRQCVLVLTNKITPHTLALYYDLRKATGETADVFFLYHTNAGSAPPELEGVRVETFGDDVLQTLGYQPIGNKLLPGNNHFPVLQFSARHPEYTYYWCIEDDVVFNGDWTEFFKGIPVDLHYDFITSHLRNYADIPTWFWWRMFFYPEGTFSKEQMYNSFNPIYRISRVALQYIDTCLKNGYSGHHEVVLPSLLKKAGFAIADLGTEDNHLTPRLSFCTLRTMRWKPVFLFLGNLKNKLYHPVKQTVTFRQLLVYIKRSLLNTKRYLTD